MIQDGEEYYETGLKERDLISVPAGCIAACSITARKRR